MILSIGFSQEVAGVIGRKVQNCHPRESVDTVEEIIRAFRAGEQERQSFGWKWVEKFIYIIYNAVRDDEGNFRGVLEMMQDVTGIRGLEGNQRLISWNTEKQDVGNEEEIKGRMKMSMELQKKQL